MALVSDLKAQQILGDVLDPKKVVLVCEQHPTYSGNLPPVKPPFASCKGCWTVFYTNMIARTAPGDRDAKLDMLTDVVRYTIEAAEQGQPPVLDRHPQITIEKEK